jgi:hypothetical protein
MTGTVLERSLSSIIARLQKLRILRRQTGLWLMLLVPAIVVTMWLPPQVGYLGVEFPVVLGTTLIGILLARLLVKNPTRTEAARLIEKTDPEVNDAVITAVQVADRAERRPSVLAAMAIQEADKLARHRDWSGVVPGRQMTAWTVLSFLSFVLMVSSVMAASRYGRDLLKPSSIAERAESNTEAPATPVTELVIEPGNTEIELGAALTVVARFPGVSPAKSVLEFTDAKSVSRQLTMSETVDAGVFAARMEEITGDGIYRVLYSEAESQSATPLISPTFNVKTYVRPKLEQVDAVITPPAWAGRPQETIEDVMRITVTEGSTVTLKLYLNKPVAKAELQARDLTTIELTPSSTLASTIQNAGDGKSAAESAVISQPLSAVMEATMVVADSNVWTVLLEDSEGRKPKDEEQITIKVVFNQPAKIKPTFPGRDTNVSPLQEFLVEAQASDDFNLVDYGVQFSLSGGETKELSLKAPATTSAATAVAVSPAEASSATLVVVEPLLAATLSHKIEMETLSAAPDDLVTYSFWATDIAADGTERRSYSDIVFAEVRRFEEIFREAQQGGDQQQQQQQQSQSQQQQGSAIDGVLKLQKEIISATWNTIRAEVPSRRNGTFAQDVETIADSQGEAKNQLQAAMEELQSDPKTAALAARAMDEMTAAGSKLQDVSAGTEGARLADAMTTEQVVVQTLLKLRLAETQVRQQQQSQGGGGGGGSSASQQQMQQLELDNQRNRYESEQQVQKQQEEKTEEQRQQLQVLNRLKELARRQQMVNDRLKQLESELRAATTQKEREEIERELKRLRDEQREMLRDVDELSERMEQATNPQDAQSSEMKQQMEEARENVQQASRAMDEGRLAEAISEGTRAERQFEDLKEDFRNQTSSQFEESVRDLREQARALGDRQKELAQQLTGNSTEDDKSQKPSLRSERNRDQLQKEFGEQKDRLNRVVDQAKQMIEQAEQSEPLLSNKLYETLRELKDSKPEEALEATEFLAGRGMWSQSQEAEQAARKGIEQLQKGIENAADSVLGSEAESLRRAQRQLEDATRKLASEVQSATGEAADAETENRRPGQFGVESETESGEKPGEESEASEGKNGEPGKRPGQSGQQQRSGQKSQQGDRAGQKGRSGEKGVGEQGQAGEDAKADDAQEPSEQNPANESEPKGSGGGGQRQNDEKQNDQKRSGQKGSQGQKGSGQSGEGKPGGGKGSENNEPQDGKSQDGQPQEGQPQNGKSQGEGASQGKSENESGQGESSGSPQQSDSDQSQPGEPSQNQSGGNRNGQRRQSSLMDGGRESNGGAGSNNASARPLTGEEFGEWSDQLRDIEEMLEDSELRNRVAQVRDRARAMRAEFKRHGEMPQWDLVKSQLLGEMQALQQRINQEVMKLESDRAMVPIDREPVPEEFDSLVQRYYELLSQERNDEPAADVKK